MHTNFERLLPFSVPSHCWDSVPNSHSTSHSHSHSNSHTQSHCHSRRLLRFIFEYKLILANAYFPLIIFCTPLTTEEQTWKKNNCNNMMETKFGRLSESFENNKLKTSLALISCSHHTRGICSGNHDCRMQFNRKLLKNKMQTRGGRVEDFD